MGNEKTGLKGLEAGLGAAAAANGIWMQEMMMKQRVTFECVCVCVCVCERERERGGGMRETMHNGSLIRKNLPLSLSLSLPLSQWATFFPNIIYSLTRMNRKLYQPNKWSLRSLLLIKADSCCVELSVSKSLQQPDSPETQSLYLSQRILMRTWSSSSNLGNGWETRFEREARPSWAKLWA